LSAPLLICSVAVLTTFAVIWAPPAPPAKAKVPAFSTVPTAIERLVLIVALSLAAGALPVLRLAPLAQLPLPLLFQMTIAIQLFPYRTIYSRERPFVP
jgi:hypothetical protein